MVDDAAAQVIRMEGVQVWVDDRTPILRDIDWTVKAGEHWALIGPNGSGKSTLLSLAGAVRHPSAGMVFVLGKQIGRTSLWDLRERIGVVDPGLAMHDWLTAEEIALSGLTGTIQPRWECYGDGERRRARAVLRLLGSEALLDREIKGCSQGERQRVRLARALIGDPALLLLDEPATGLDLPAREALIAAIAGLAESRPDLASVLVSHHLEELPPSVTHAALLRDGRLVASGPVGETITSETVSLCFGFAVAVRRDEGRWHARAAGGWRPPK